MLWLGVQSSRATPGWGECTPTTPQWWWRNLHWRRGSDVWKVPPVITRRRTFSMCGKLVGHFPVCGCLRVVAAAIKHRVTSVMSGWDDEVHDITLRCMITETMERVMQNDPVHGDWCINGNELTIWVDASSLAMGVTLDDKGSIIEDACWLQPENDMQHINLAELDATLMGLTWLSNVKQQCYTSSQTQHAPSIGYQMHWPEEHNWPLRHWAKCWYEGGSPH